jgi:hypothetical protein
MKYSHVAMLKPIYAVTSATAGSTAVVQFQYVDIGVNLFFGNE